MANTSDASVDTSVFTLANGADDPIEAVLDPNFTKLPWYRWWLQKQLHSQPKRLWLALPDTGDGEEPGWDSSFLPLWNRVREVLVAPGPKTIEGITDKLIELGILSTKENYEAYQSAKEMIFSIVGWQTMLYKPDLLTCSTGGFGILNEMGGHSGGAQICLNQSPIAGKHDLPTFLLGFGMMLPPRNYCAFDEADDRQIFHKTKVIISKDLNAHVLTKICGIKIQWVDSLSCHLELDKHSGVLFLYRYPSFCVASLQHRDSERRNGAIYSCGLELPGPVPWATEEDVTELLREILLSYRILFGQSRRSRAFFRRLRPFANTPREGQDQLLVQICCKKNFKSSVTLVERGEYDVASDFPHLRSRFVRLNDYVSSKKPRSIRQLWMDKRDSTAWLAFWSVFIFGSISFILAAVQTALQIMQYVLALQQGHS